MRKIVLTFGFIGGGIIAVMMLITMAFQDQIGFDRGAIVGYTTMVLAFLMVFFGIKSYRDNVAGGTVKFGRACKVGVLIALVTSLCYVATWELLYNKLMPDFMDKYAAFEVQKAKASGGSEERIAVEVKRLADFKETYRNPAVRLPLSFIEVFPVGLILTLVSSGIISRKRSA